VIDADGLNLWRLERVQASLVLDAAPGRGGRLLGVACRNPADRYAACMNPAAYGGSCVLKGAGTSCKCSDQRCAVCAAGNPA